MYIVTTSWKHNEPIDPEKMTAHLTSLKGSQEGVVDVMWFKIDEHTHGSVLIYESEQHYKNATAARDENRKTSDVTMLSEQKGATIAVMSEI